MVSDLVSSNFTWNLKTCLDDNSYDTYTYIFTISPSFITTSVSLLKGVKWQIQLFKDIQVGNAIPENHKQYYISIEKGWYGIANKRKFLSKNIWYLRYK